MKRLKRMASCLSIALLLGGLFAQPAEAQRRARGDNSVKLMENHLDLSDEQKEQLKKIVDEAKAEAKSNRENVQSEIDAILTPEQKAKREGLIEGRKMASKKLRGTRGKNKQRGMRNRGRSMQNNRGRMNRSSNLRGLNLSDEQKESLKTFRAEQKESIETWKKDNPDASREDQRKAMEQSREDMETKIASILDEDQKAKMEEMKDGNNNRGRRGNSRRGRR